MSASPVYVVDARRRALILLIVCVSLVALFFFAILYYNVPIFSATYIRTLELPFFPGIFAVLAAIGFFKGRRIEFYENGIRTALRHLPLEDVTYANLILGPVVARGRASTFTMATKPGVTTPSGATFRVAVFNRMLPALNGMPLYNWVYPKVYSSTESGAPVLDYVRYGPRKRSFVYAGVVCLVLFPVLLIGGPAIFWTIPATPDTDVGIGFAFVFVSLILAGIGVFLIRHRPRLP